jgi:redox-sensing transcriptional repressor
MPIFTIPSDTIKRLFKYYQALVESRQSGVISSEELFKLSGFSAAQIRKDLSHFGQFGTPGKGYEVERLNHQIKGILGIDREWSVALIGIGNLGKALLTYQGLKQQGFKITQLFDNDPEKVGKSCMGLAINNVETLCRELQANPVKMAIVAVPAKATQGVLNMLVESGVRAILNFAPTRAVVPPEVKVLNIDVTNELARLSYFLTQEQGGSGSNPAQDETFYKDGNDVY